MPNPTFLAQVLLARKRFESLLSEEVKTVHVSLSKLMAEDAGGAWSITAYYTKGITMREIAISSEKLDAMVSYYAKAEHVGHGGPYARWYGNAIPALGLVPGAEVDPRRMRRLLQLLDPLDGSRLPNNGGMRAQLSAMDMTFSLEKELGAIWLLGDDERRAQLELIADVAMNEAIAWGQKEASVVRRGPGGIAHFSASGFAAIEVDHTTARPVDGLAAPHLHRHIVIFNAAELDGKWTALDAERLFDIQKPMAEIAGQKVREMTSKMLGVTWERDDDGIYRILGFDAGLRNKLSLRQAQILERALADGLDPTSRGDWVKAQRISREGKNACGDDPEAAQWAIEMMAEKGITFETLIRDLHRAAKEKIEEREQVRRDRRWIDSTFPPCPEDGDNAEVWRLNVARELATIHTVGTISVRFRNEPGSTLDFIPPAFDRLSAAMNFVEPPTQDEVALKAMMDVGRARSTWRRKDLITALTGSDIGLGAAEKYARDFLKSDQVVGLKGITDDPESSVRVRIANQIRYATVETLEKERAFVLATREGVGALESLATDEQFRFVLAKMAERGKPIDPESDQYQMVYALLRGTNQIQLLDGQAGSGKSAAIEALVIAREMGLLGAPTLAEDPEVGLSLVGCSLTANAAEGLQKISGMPAYSITMLASRLEKGAITLSEGAIVVLDEMSQASTASLSTLLKHVQVVNGRFVMTGNFRQLQAVQAGGLIPTLLENCPEAVVLLDETRRQENLEERAVLAQMHYRGRLWEKRNSHAVDALIRQGLEPEFVRDVASGGLEAVRDWLVANDRLVVHESVEEAIAAIACEYWDAVALSSESFAEAAIVTATSNPETAMLNQAIMDEAIKRGLLDPEKTVEFGRKEWLLNQRVILRKVDWELDVRNGQNATVLGTEVVGTRWVVEFETPSPYSLTRNFKSQTKVGAEEMVRFSATQVAAERKRAAKNLERQETISARSGGKNNEALAEAEKWVSWASGLPNAGGSIPLTVTRRTRKSSEERLILQLDNGEGRSVPAKYAQKYIDGGYAITKPRAQGQTVDYGIEYKDISYVGMSRGRKWNRAHLVVRPPDSFQIEQERLALAETYKWLSDTLGADETRNFIDSNRTREASDKTASAIKIHDGLSVVAVGAERVKTERVIEEIAACQVLGERRVGVVRSSEMASAMSDAVIKCMKEHDRDGVFVTTIDGRKWVKNMPVIVARGDLNGLEHGKTYYIAATSKNALWLEIEDGKKVKVSGKEVKDLDSGLVVTAGRLQAGIGPVDKIIAVASGLDEDQLNLLAALPSTVEIVISDPDVTGVSDYQHQVSEKIMELLKKDSGTGWDSRSALDYLKWREGEEVGLKDLQAAVQMTAKVIDETRNLTPRELAGRDLERELIGLRKHLVEIKALSDQSDDHEELLDLRDSLLQTEGSIVDRSSRLETLNRRDIGDSNPQVAAEIGRSTTWHATDAKRMKDAEALLQNFVEVRVTEALTDPQPYHPALDFELPVKEAHEKLHEQLTVIEEYRAKWGVQDYELALGEEPEEDGLQHDEFERAAEILRGKSDLKYELEIEMQVGPTR